MIHPGFRMLAGASVWDAPASFTLVNREQNVRKK